MLGTGFSSNKWELSQFRCADFGCMFNSSHIDPKRILLTVRTACPARIPPR